MRQLRSGGKLAGVQAGRRRRSAAWERGEGKGASEIDSWGSCKVRALARRARRALSRAAHGGVAVAAVGVALEAAGRMARLGRLQREATGGGGGVARRVGASATEKGGREASPRRRRRCRRWAAAKQSRGWWWKKRMILKFPKIPGTIM